MQSAGSSPIRANAKRPDCLDWQPGAGGRLANKAGRVLSPLGSSAGVRLLWRGRCGERIGGVGGVRFECGGGSVGARGESSGTLGTWTSHPGREHTACLRQRGRDALEAWCGTAICHNTRAIDSRPRARPGLHRALVADVQAIRLTTTRYMSDAGPYNRRMSGPPPCCVA